VRDWPGPDQQAELVRRCAGYKALVVAQDPREQGLRAILNLGHTIGHGVETAAAGRLRHGEAVSIGLVAALRLSVERAGLDPAVAGEITEILAGHGLPVIGAGLDPAAVLAAMRHDKKRAAGGHRFVLLERVAAPVFGVEVPDEAVERAVAGSVGAGTD
jgi:3-dehydroquinate synthetase